MSEAEQQRKRNRIRKIFSESGDENYTTTETLSLKDKNDMDIDAFMPSWGETEIIGFMKGLHN